MLSHESLGETLSIIRVLISDLVLKIVSLKEMKELSADGVGSKERDYHIAAFGLVDGFVCNR